jgi:hypothetical protein
MNTPAMPAYVWNYTKGEWEPLEEGFTKLEYAAIQLKVTHPDCPGWLNQMIEKSVSGFSNALMEEMGK